MCRRRAIALAFVVLVAAGSAVLAGSQPTRGPASAARPRLAVFIVVDGLSWERLSALRPWFTAGLKRLFDEGAVATQCRYGHLNTETAPGHASLSTGAPPRVHGIALNQWYLPSPDGASMRTIYSASQPLPGEPENSEKTVPGAGRLRVATLADRLAMRNPASKVVSLANKDRSAIFLAGRDPRHAVYWYSSPTGTYVTSAAFDATSAGGLSTARVVARFNADNAGPHLAAHVGTIWSRLPAPEPPPAHGYTSGLADFQDAIVGPSFPHDLTAAKRPLPSALLWTPFADRLLVELALDLLADDGLALGRDDAPDVLAVSFSASDYASHYYGPESVEELEVLRGLDLSIGRLLDDLTARFGKDGVLLALSADHGFLPMPEVTKRADPAAPALRVRDVTILAQLNAAVNAELGRKDATPLVYRFEGCSLWLDRTALAAAGAPDAERVLGIVKRELAGTWKNVILRTFDVDGALPAKSGDELVMRVANARVPGRCGDLFAVSRFGVLVDPYDGKGSSHGTPWEYDTHVPLIFWGGGVGARELAAPSTPYDLAPTMASWLGLDLPDATGTRLKLWRK
jgi:predicted AlkP superfamily pyrophosphatase or phosphodiesterase